MNSLNEISIVKSEIARLNRDLSNDFEQKIDKLHRKIEYDKNWQVRNLEMKIDFLITVGISTYILLLVFLIKYSIANR